jgi:hypothetical protein
MRDAMLELYVCPKCRGHGFVRGWFDSCDECWVCDPTERVLSAEGHQGWAEPPEGRDPTCERCGARDPRSAQAIFLDKTDDSRVVMLCGACFDALPVGRETPAGWTF